MTQYGQESITISFDTFPAIHHLAEKEQKLVKLAQAAARQAYAPYSKFNVGAAVLLENGECITGSNQENEAYPSGLCAERVALFYASSQFPNSAIKALCIAAMRDNQLLKTPVPPCGSCRQVFSEWEKRFKKPFTVIMSGTNKIIRVKNSGLLLPFSFQGDIL
jgi:cytidine deaminase